jgi:predicted transcriptional regulator
MERRIKITIVKSSSPSSSNLNEELQWFSRSLGLFDSKRDKEKSCFRIFVQLLKSKKPLSSDEIALSSNLSRGTVIHHIHNLTERGIVKEERKRYELMDRNLQSIVKRMEEQIDSTLSDLKKIAKKIDEEI